MNTAAAASAVIYGGVEAEGVCFNNLESALAEPNSEVRLFGKPVAFERRRMGVALNRAETTDAARVNAKRIADCVKVCKS
jgi:phosphoribosylglycinamide formyltransferase 2